MRLRGRKASPTSQSAPMASLPEGCRNVGSGTDLAHPEPCPWCLLPSGQYHKTHRLSGGLGPGEGRGRDARGEKWQSSSLFFKNNFIYLVILAVRDLCCYTGISLVGVSRDT